MKNTKDSKPFNYTVEGKLKDVAVFDSSLQKDIRGNTCFYIYIDR